MRAVEQGRVQRGRRHRHPRAFAAPADGALLGARSVIEGVEVVVASVGLLGREGDVSGGGGDGWHVAERGGVVQDGGPAEGDGLAAGGALEAVNRWDVQLVGAVAVGGLLGRDLDVLLGRGVHPDHAVDPDFDT